MRKAKSLTFDIRKTYPNNGATMLCLPKDQMKYAKMDAGDPVAVLQNRTGEPIELKDGDIVVRNIKGLI